MNGVFCNSNYLRVYIFLSEILALNISLSQLMKLHHQLTLFNYRLLMRQTKQLLNINKSYLVNKLNNIKLITQYFSQFFIFMMRKVTTERRTANLNDFANYDKQFVLQIFFETVNFTSQQYNKKAQKRYQTERQYSIPQDLDDIQQQSHNQQKQTLLHLYYQSILPDNNKMQMSTSIHLDQDQKQFQLSDTKSNSLQVQARSSIKSQKNESIKNRIRRASFQEITIDVKLYENAKTYHQSKLKTLESLSTIAGIQKERNLFLEDKNMFLKSRIHDQLEVHYNELYKQSPALTIQQTEELEYTTFRIVKQTQKQKICDLRQKFMLKIQEKKH